MRKCRFCAEEIQDAAIVCKHCGRDQSGKLPVVQTTPKTGPVTWLVSVIAAIVVISFFVRACFGPTP